VSESCEEEYQRETREKVKSMLPTAILLFAYSWVMFLFPSFVERQHKPGELKTSTAATTPRRIESVE
jgi:hypothetical protein